MLLSIQKKVLQSALKTVCSVIDGVSLTPINESVYIKLQNGIIKFQTLGTNGAAQFQTTNGLEIEEEGEILIKAKLLYNIISKIQNPQIKLQTVDNSVLRISVPNFSSDINLFDVATFPLLNFQYDSWKKIQITSTFIKNILTKLVPCASTTDSKNIACNNILIDSSKQPNIIQSIGTDGNHLAYLQDNYQGEQIKIVVGIQILKLIEGFLDNPTITLFINNKNLIFQSGETTLLMKTTEGEYPDLSKPLQLQNPNKIIINTKTLNNAIDKAIILASADKKPAIQLAINKNTIKITARNIEYGSTFEEINIQNPSDVNETFTLNAKYLIDLLKNISTENLVLEFSTSHKPIIIKEENNPNYTSLILPIMSL
jgi:DNA polymerase-3 subunit beta